ncbi:DUF5694 domain-containing protein [Ekhidna sp.]|uniref:DUF5694 domain-containing protein n=1 Tax=Ekhidna sp. TaxID=2608089 RepID=UPI003CCC2466
MKNVALVILIEFLLVGCAPSIPERKQEFEIPQNPKYYNHQVMVLGSFHFQKSGDGSDVVGNAETEILSKENQLTIDSFTNRIIQEFDPTIIAIEWMPKYQGLVDSLYRSYKDGMWKLEENEAFQIGFRIAKSQGLTSVYCVDNRPIQPRSVLKMDDWEAYADSIGHRAKMEEYDSSNAAYNQYLDSIRMEMTIYQYLELLNSPDNISRNKELWFAGLVNLGHGDTYVGADLTGHWYQRNSRIFTNVRNLAQTKNERILIIYGMAHKWVLDEMFEASPEFEVIQPSEILF